MKNIFTFLLFCSLISYGQNPGYSIGSNGLTYFNPRSSQNALEIEILNSPYNNNFYQEGKITIHEKPGFVTKMRYNAAKNVIEFKEEDGTVKELLRRPYISAEFGGKEYVVFKYVVPYTKNEKLGYFNPLNNGKTQLLYMPEKSLEVSGYSTQERRSGSYSDKSSYYIKKAGRPAVEINLNKSSILGQLDTSYHEELKDFVTKNNLNLRNEADVLALLKHYNLLLSTGNAFTKPVQS
jgi:hypothetical protein